MSDKKCPNCSYEIDSWNDCTSVNNILECPECEEHFELKAVRLNKPQLTIPKSIADALDKVTFHNPIAQLSNKDCDLTDFNDTVKRYAWNNKENGYICVAYLTGKALGVDLVKVGEG
ncbi:hypothetical protein EFL15_12950 [Lactococcus cremoris]|nr:hypothetical protein [Lactococcus cremoris]